MYLVLILLLSSIAAEKYDKEAMKTASLLAKCRYADRTLFRISYLKPYTRRNIYTPKKAVDEHFLIKSYLRDVASYKGKPVEEAHFENGENVLVYRVGNTTFMAKKMSGNYKIVEMEMPRTLVEIR